MVVESSPPLRAMTASPWLARRTACCIRARNCSSASSSPTLAVSKWSAASQKRRFRTEPSSPDSRTSAYISLLAPSRQASSEIPL